MPTAAEWTHINATGATIITGSTILGALYLMFALWKQGRGKLRVRLLLGMVVSDVLLGNDDMRMFYKTWLTQNLQGFFLTAVLWQQHLWTLAIAIATFLLLVFLDLRSVHLDLIPRSLWTYVELGRANVVWWRYAGWVSNGNLCYYTNPQTAAGVGAGDLIQFIPRAIVFLVILVLYSMLFRFLRRPDTIQLSSQFVSGSFLTDTTPKNRLSARLGLKQDAKVDPKAPWEALDFIHVGKRGDAMDLSSPITSQHTFTSPMTAGPHLPDALPIPLDSPGEKVEDSFSLHSLRASLSSSKRPSHDILMLPALSQARESAATAVQLDDNGRVMNLSPILSDGKGSVASALPQTPIEQQNQTLQEFFQQYEPANLDHSGDAERGRAGQPQMSATAYFNRQASLLMMYFPLAYLLVFSVSIARLIYNMISPTPNQLLNLLSSWFVLSVGFIDALVYKSAAEDAG